MLQVAFLLLACAPAQAAESAWILTTTDFMSEPVDLRSVDSSQIRVARRNGPDRSIPLDQFVKIEREAAIQTRAPELFLLLSTGDRIGGEPIKLSGEQFRFRNGVLGEVVYPLRQVTAMVRAGAIASGAAGGAAAVEDVIRLLNGDTVHGIVSDITADSISIQPSASGEPSQVPIASIAAVEFASTAAGSAASAPPAVKRPRSFRVTLTDGSILSGSDIAGDDRELRITLSDGSTRPVPMAIVAGIEQVDGPLVWLSSLEPTEDVQTSSFGDRAAPARMDRSVTGDRIRAGGAASGRVFVRGIGVHSYSKVSFSIEGGNFVAFHTQYAIDGDLPLADVTARILLDGQTVWEKQNVRSSTQLALPVTIDVAGHKTLTLEVDYGENYDVQDRFNWIEPALLRTRPTDRQAPATHPAN